MTTKRKITRLLIDGEPEPEFGMLGGDDIEIIRALNYYARNCDFNKSKEFLLEWVDENTPSLVSKLVNSDPYEIKNLGFVARMISRGLNSDTMNNHLNSELNRIASIVIKKDDAPKQPKQRMKAVEPNLTLESFDYALDAVVSGKEVEPLYATTNKSHIEEVRNVVDKISSEVESEPSQYTYVATLKRFLKSTIQQLESWSVVAKKQRTKKVAPKKIDPIKMVSKLVLERKDESLGLTGLAPTKIVGATKLLVWHPERRVLTVFISSDDNGFMVSSKSLKNFDIEKSISKKIRKPELMRDEIKDLTMTRAHYWLRDDCKTTETPAKAMIPDGSIILKIQ